MASTLPLVLETAADILVSIVCLERFYPLIFLKIQVCNPRKRALAPAELATITDLDKSLRGGDGLFQLMTDVVVRGSGRRLEKVHPDSAKEVKDSLVNELTEGMTEDRFWATFVQCLVCKTVTLRKHFAVNHVCGAKQDATWSEAPNDYEGPSSPTSTEREETEDHDYEPPSDTDVFGDIEYVLMNPFNEVPRAPEGEAAVVDAPEDVTDDLSDLELPTVLEVYDRIIATTPGAATTEMGIVDVEVLRTVGGKDGIANNSRGRALPDQQPNVSTWRTRAAANHNARRRGFPMTSYTTSPSSSTLNLMMWTRRQYRPSTYPIQASGSKHFPNAFKNKFAVGLVERIGKDNNGEPESAPRVIVATLQEIEQSRGGEEEMAFGEGPSTIRFDSNDIDAMDTVRIEADEGSYCYGLDGPSMNQRRSSSCASMQVDSTRSQIGETDFSPTQPLTTASLSPSAGLPSPLICPRRPFLAVLILGSKFTQHKCYSNHAWAKLSGLPPKGNRPLRECPGIGLGVVSLDWQAACAAMRRPAQPPAASRAVMRCQSEISLNMKISSPSETINHPPMIDKSSASVPETAAVASGELTVPATMNLLEIAASSRVPLRYLKTPCRDTSTAHQELSYPWRRCQTLGTHQHAIRSVVIIPPCRSTASCSPGRVELWLFIDYRYFAQPRYAEPELLAVITFVVSIESVQLGRQYSALQMNTFQEAHNPTEFFNSPVARIDVMKLLVPGFNDLNGSFRILSFGAYTNKGLAPFSISSEIIGEKPEPHQEDPQLHHWDVKHKFAKSYESFGKITKLEVHEVSQKLAEFLCFYSVKSADNQVTSLEGNTTVRELLKEVKEDTADKYAHDLTLLRIYRTIALGLDVDEDKLAPQAAQYH
ncbi:hypothetical protein FA13DRAFT_1796523 [Coprinellus micaceus]|uniref:Uncharacterized protein n=1 Tax=Coprinellus micaceus TaxID=71717 RepID=A0A4Y7SU94_COPMI|nr:hypothetical protein FA13DRAFT_1796523 [Coprinellus micaceus]